MATNQHTIVIAGAGTFGTALAERFSWNIHNTVLVYNRDQKVVDDINRNHRNSKYFPAHILASSVRATTDPGIFATGDVILLAIPSKAIVPFAQQIRPIVKHDPLVVNFAKGMSDDGAFITERIPFNRKASMKGPSFAIEVLNGLPTGFTFGGSRDDYKKFKIMVLDHTSIQLDYTSDIRAVELLSILKNMYAIAIGVVSGRYNSPNVDFLIYTKAVREMRGFLERFGCDPQSIFLYCGIGDLGLTSLNDLSRNRTMGLLMGKGFAIDQEASPTTLEGYRTVRSMHDFIIRDKAEKDFPIALALYRLIYEKESVNQYISTVLAC